MVESVCGFVRMKSDSLGGEGSNDPFMFLGVFDISRAIFIANSEILADKAER